MHITCVNDDCRLENIKFVKPPGFDEFFCAVCSAPLRRFQDKFQHEVERFSDKGLDVVEWPGFLEHGKLYDCQMDFKDEIIKESIIPFARDLHSLKRFVMMDARSLFTQNPTFIDEIAEMTFDEILNEGISDKFPFNYEASIIAVLPFSDGSLMDLRRLVRIFDFIKTDLR